MPKIIYPLATLAFAILLWQAAVVLLDIPIYLLPAPTDAAGALVERFDYLLRHAQITAAATLIGFALSVIIGLPIGTLMVVSEPVQRAIYPLVVSSQTIPKIALAPLFIVWFGFGLVPKVLMALLIAFFPITIATVVGLQAAQPEMIQLLRSMGASRVEEFTKVRLPNAMPIIFGGVRVAVALAIVGTVVGEFVGSNSGLGYVLILANSNIDTPLLFAAISFLVVFGLVMFWAVSLVERRVTSWQPRNSFDIAPEIQTS